MEAVILVGGQGTRLKSVVSDIPKPMAPIGDTPFLQYVLDDLAAQGVTRVILSTGYRHEVVEAYFGNSYQSLNVAYSVEETPLGTGGAIRKALQQVTQPDVLILNGDTLFRVNLADMNEFHRTHRADLTLALKTMSDCSRYGRVETEDHRVTQFKEKMAGQPGSINGGVYLLNESVFPVLEQLLEKFSFEKDFLEAHYRSLRVLAYSSDAYFIDIGIPEDFARAQRELPQLR